MNEKEFKTSKKSKGGDIALKDFTIKHNEYFIEIKKGDSIQKLQIPNEFIINLKTEKVI